MSFKREKRRRPGDGRADLGIARRSASSSRRPPRRPSFRPSFRATPSRVTHSAGVAAAFAAAHAAAHAAAIPKFHHARAATPCASLWHKKTANHNDVVTARNQILAAPPEAFGLAINAFDAFEAFYTCHSERCVGGLVGDGGNFVCGKPSHFKAAPCLVYSVGSGGNVTFENEVIAKYGCEVHTFDPSGPTDVLKAAVEATGTKFYARGIGPEDGTFPNADTGVANPVLPIHEIVARQGHEGRHIDIFKIDCKFGRQQRVV